MRMSNGEEHQGQPVEKQPGCHCRSERLAIIIGDKNDATIGAAKQWLLGFPQAGRRIWFSSAAGGTANMDSPYVPNAAGTDWKRFERTPGHTGDTKQLGASLTDFCFFEEIIVMAH